jgi:hypothetical protein
MSQLRAGLHADAERVAGFGGRLNFHIGYDKYLRQRAEVLLEGSFIGSPSGRRRVTAASSDFPMRPAARRGSMASFTGRAA